MKDEKKLKGEIVMNDGSTALRIRSWIFGLVFLAIGFVNTFWGNYPGFSVSIVLLSLIYFFPVNAMLKNMTGFSIPIMR